MQFRATLHLSGKTSTGIPVPPEIVTALGSRKRPAVIVTIGHHTYRTTIAPMGGDFWIPVSAEQRQAAAITAGDELDIHIELDTAPREVIVPPDLAAALAADPPASAAFEALLLQQQAAHRPRPRRREDRRNPRPPPRDSSLRAPTHARQS